MARNRSTKVWNMIAEHHNRVARNQFVVDEVTQPALNNSVHRILDSLPATTCDKDPTRRNPIRISDLGSAGGTCAIHLLRRIETLLQQRNETRPIEYFFNDLPSSDFNVLVNTIHDSKLSNQFFPMCIGRSFYERLFPPNSMDLHLSYLALHWMSNCPGKHLSPHETDPATATEGKERGNSPSLFQRWRAVSIEDLSLFLRLRADELRDQGEVVVLMVGGGSLGGDEENKSNPYGGVSCRFLYGANGTIYEQAFGNAAKDPRYSDIQGALIESLEACYVPYFLRCESDVRESLSNLSDVLELIELKWSNQTMKFESPAAIWDFMWSIHANAIEESIKIGISHCKPVLCDSRADVRVDDSTLFNKVLQAFKVHSAALFDEIYADGEFTSPYMHMVARRKSR